MVTTTHSDQSRSARSESGPPTFGEMFRASPWLFLDGMVLISAVIVVGAFFYFYEDSRNSLWQALGYGWVPVGLWAASIILILRYQARTLVHRWRLGAWAPPWWPLRLRSVLPQPRSWSAGGGLLRWPLGYGPWRSLPPARWSGQDACHCWPGPAGVLPSFHRALLHQRNFPPLAMVPDGRGLRLPGIRSGRRGDEEWPGTHQR